MSIKDRINKMLGRTPEATYEIDGVNVDVYKDGDRFILTNAKGDTFSADYDVIETVEHGHDMGPDGYSWISTMEVNYSSVISLRKGGEAVYTHEPPCGYSAEDIKQLRDVVRSARTKFLRGEVDEKEPRSTPDNIKTTKRLDNSFDR